MMRQLVVGLGDLHQVMVGRADRVMAHYFPQKITGQKKMEVQGGVLVEGGPLCSCH